MDPSCIKQPVGLFTQPNEANGDCLFLSIAQAINSYSGNEYDALKAHLRMLGLRLGKVTSTQLRALVYMLFLVSCPEVDGVIDAWRMARSASAELSHEYAQARGLPDNVPTAELTPAQRTSFFEACMNPRLCWGEETALEFLERLLSIRCLVIVKKVLQTRSLTKAVEAFRPLLFIPLSLSNAHYQSVLWEDAEGQECAAFSENELPDILLFLAQRDCSMVEASCINLRHRIAAALKENCGDSTPAETAPTANPPFTFDESLLQHLFICRRSFEASSL